MSRFTCHKCGAYFEEDVPVGAHAECSNCGAVFPVPKNNIEDTDSESVRQLVLENPFRVLGIYVGAPIKEISRNQARARAFLKVGRLLSYPVDAGLPELHRTPEMMQQADAAIALPMMRMVHACFWFADDGSEACRRCHHAIAESDWEAAERAFKGDCVSSVSIVNRAVICFLRQDYASWLGGIGTLLQSSAWESYVEFVCGRGAAVPSDSFVAELIRLFRQHVSEEVFSPGKMCSGGPLFEELVEARIRGVLKEIERIVQDTDFDDIFVAVEPVFKTNAALLSAIAELSSVRVGLRRLIDSVSHRIVLSATLFNNWNFGNTEKTRRVHALLQVMSGWPLQSDAADLLERFVRLQESCCNLLQPEDSFSCKTDELEEILEDAPLPGEVGALDFLYDRLSSIRDIVSSLDALAVNKHWEEYLTVLYDLGKRVLDTVTCYLSRVPSGKRAPDYADKCVALVALVDTWDGGKQLQAERGRMPGFLAREAPIVLIRLYPLKQIFRMARDILFSHWTRSDWVYVAENAPEFAAAVLQGFHDRYSPFSEVSKQALTAATAYPCAILKLKPEYLRPLAPSLFMCLWRMSGNLMELADNYAWSHLDESQQAEIVAAYAVAPGNEIIPLHMFWLPRRESEVCEAADEMNLLILFVNAIPWKALGPDIVRRLREKLCAVLGDEILHSGRLSDEAQHFLDFRPGYLTASECIRLSKEDWSVMAESNPSCVVQALVRLWESAPIITSAIEGVFAKVSARPSALLKLPRSELYVLPHTLIMHLWRLGGAEPGIVDRYRWRCLTFDEQVEIVRAAILVGLKGYSLFSYAEGLSVLIRKKDRSIASYANAIPWGILAPAVAATLFSSLNAQIRLGNLRVDCLSEDVQYRLASALHVENCWDPEKLSQLHPQVVVRLLISVNAGGIVDYYDFTSFEEENWYKLARWAPNEFKDILLRVYVKYDAASAELRRIFQLVTVNDSILGFLPQNVMLMMPPALFMLLWRYSGKSAKIATYYSWSLLSFGDKLEILREFAPEPGENGSVPEIFSKQEIEHLVRAGDPVRLIQWYDFSVFSNDELSAFPIDYRLKIMERNPELEMRYKDWLRKKNDSGKNAAGGGCLSVFLGVGLISLVFLLIVLC